MTRIYNYYKKYGYKTQVMGASFRNVSQIVRLAGCDLLTISPELLDKLEQYRGTSIASSTRRKPKRSGRPASPGRKDVSLDAQRRRHGDEKLAEGIRKFTSDASRLQQYALFQMEAKVG